MGSFRKECKEAHLLIIILLCLQCSMKHNLYIFWVVKSKVDWRTRVGGNLGIHTKKTILLQVCKRFGYRVVWCLWTVFYSNRCELVSRRMKWVLCCPLVYNHCVMNKERVSRPLTDWFTVQSHHLIFSRQRILCLVLLFNWIISLACAIFPYEIHSGIFTNATPWTHKCQKWWEFLTIHKNLIKNAYRWNLNPNSSLDFLFHGKTKNEIVLSNWGGFSFIAQ